MAGAREPLDAVLWFESLRRLVPQKDAPLESRLRLSFALVNLAPPPISKVVHCQLDETAFESLLKAGDFEGAAVSLLGTLLSYEVVRRPQDEATARVWLAGSPAEGQATSASAASAVLEAWLDFLLCLKG